MRRTDSGQLEMQGLTVMPCRLVDSQAPEDATSLDASMVEDASVMVDASPTLTAARWPMRTLNWMRRLNH